MVSGYRISNKESIELDKPFSDYHLDSLTAAEFSDDIHDWLGVEVPITLVWNYPTLADMTRYLSAKSNGKTEEELRPEPTEKAVHAILDDIENLSDEQAQKLLEENEISLITGVTGQDGSYLAELLLSKDYKVIGLKRRTSTDSLDRLSSCVNHPNFSIVESEISDAGSVYDAVNKYKPDEIYNLAAQSHVGSSFEQPDFTFQVNALGPLHFLEAIRRFSPYTRFYQASTSEMFGKNYTEISDVYDGRTVEIKYQNEDTAFSASISIFDSQTCCS